MSIDQESPVLYTAGYCKGGKRIDPDAFFGSLPNTAIVVDIRACRYSPYMPGYSGKVLSSVASSNRAAIYRLFTYRWLPELGNQKVEGKRRMPPTYKDAETGFKMLETWLRLFGTIVIFCACEKAEDCHRSAIADEMQRRVPALKIVHL